MSRRFLVPEIIQTTSMDCGPAALTALAEGLGRSVSYGRLREACQTDVDGTSIDTIEEIAQQLGIAATQVVMPADQFLDPPSPALPAIAVVLLPGGFTHFVVVWNRIGRLFQLMDPAAGRRWVTREQLEAQMYVHRIAVSSDAWREWATSEEPMAFLRARLVRLHLAKGTGETMIRAALDDKGWRSFAALDAAARCTEGLVRARAVSPGAAAELLASEWFERARRPDGRDAIPADCWSVSPADPDGSEERVFLRGAVVLRAAGLNDLRPTAELIEGRLSPGVAAALTETPARPGLALWRLVRSEGAGLPVGLLSGLGLAALGATCEALLFRSLFGLGRSLGLWSQRLTWLSALALFFGSLWLLEAALVQGAVGLGRRLEARLRLSFFLKIPLLGDRYFSSRPVSDMAERSHALHQIRALPAVAQQLLRSGLELSATAVGLAVLDPSRAWIAFCAALLGVGLPLLLQRPLAERDLRVRSHAGALGRFHLDAMLGSSAVHNHGAERVVRREHEALLVAWARAGFALARATVALEGLSGLLGVALVAWLLSGYLRSGADLGGALLVIYWALNLPVIGQDVATQAAQYPALKNLTLRLLEPLGAPEEGGLAHELSDPSSPRPRGLAIELSGVDLRIGGQRVLEGIDLTLEPSAHVAIVGPSGAGKSSLLGLLLGWYRAERGKVRVDGKDLEGESLAMVRAETSWLDPAVQLWNRSLITNLLYGAPQRSISLDEILRMAELEEVLEALPLGLETPLGEGGRLVSGGEGQRVRYGRALQRREARLVLLDEPFRDLDRTQRQALLRRAREWWSGATLLCVTHDLEETLGFPRVVVMDQGKIVEDGNPLELAGRPSRYRELLHSEKNARAALEGSAWRRLRLEKGRLWER
jgi:ABC-type bacteriocin/lantibiotic exporter with double-glycine peptidase domain